MHSVFDHLNNLWNTGDRFFILLQMALSFHFSTDEDPQSQHFINFKRVKFYLKIYITKLIFRFSFRLTTSFQPNSQIPAV